MNKIILFILLSVSLVSGQLLTQIDNQILHLKGNVGVTASGDSVSVWADQSGNSNDFSQSTGADQPEYITSTHLDFDDVNSEYLTRADDADFSFGDATDDSPFSIAFYINFDALDAGAGLITKYTGTYEWRLQVAADDKFVLILHDNATNIYEGRKTDAAITDYIGAWTSFILTYDGGGGTTASDGIIIYVNGSLVASSVQDLSTYTAMHNLDSQIDIGKQGSTYLDAKVKEILFTSDVLTPDEIANIHTYFTTGSYPEGYEKRFKRFKDFNKFKRH